MKSGDPSKVIESIKLSHYRRTRGGEFITF